MNGERLREARDYEKVTGEKIPAKERPAFHLSPRTGWMNDPNGFSYYGGEYHLFYQYYPYETKWGLMHWGHAVSRDLIRWEYLPAALAPDEPYDRDGCFSGSAATLPDGRQLLMYTGVLKEETEDGARKVQTQCLAVGDGRNYEKYAGNPVLTKRDLPPGGSRYDFRDPKIWRNEDGSYSCVVGNRDAGGSGQILLFNSPDGFHWAYRGILAANHHRFGRMWECPDFFKLDGKWVLLTSPQDMLPQGFEYHNGNGTLCLIGDYDDETAHFEEEYNQAVDYGIDFYAPQTMVSPNGRRIMIGWMQNWDTCRMHGNERAWIGQMSLPRELSVINGRLCQAPVGELKKYRRNPVEYRNVRVSGDVGLEGIKGRMVDMELVLYAGEGTEPFRKFAVRFAQNAQYWTSFSYRPQENILKIDRKFSGSRKAIIHQRRCLLHGDGGKLRLRIILDRYSAEIFVNDGEQVITATLYTEPEADGISFYADGLVNMDIVKYDLQL